MSLTLASLGKTRFHARLLLTGVVSLSLLACSEISKPAISDAMNVQTLQTGSRVEIFANDLDHPTCLLVLPNGDVLVAENNNRITLLRDTDGDGIANLRSVFLDDLKSPQAIVLVGDDLLVIGEDSAMNFPYVAGDIRISAPGIAGGHSHNGGDASSGDKVLLDKNGSSLVVNTAHNIIWRVSPPKAIKVHRDGSHERPFLSSGQAKL